MSSNELKDDYSFRNVFGNIVRTEDFSQVCVFEIPTQLEYVSDEEFQEFIEEIVGIDLDTRFQFLEVFRNIPNTNVCSCCQDKAKDDSTHSHIHPNILFAIHNDDMKAFATKKHKLQLPIRWLEDNTSLNNGYYQKNFYPERVLGYRTWCGDVKPEMVQSIIDRDC